jgi:hypothetical protein
MFKIKRPNNHNHVTTMHFAMCTQQYLSYVLNVTTKQSCTSDKPTLYINTQQYKGYASDNEHYQFHNNYNVQQGAKLVNSKSDTNTMHSIITKQ